MSAKSVQSCHFERVLDDQIIASMAATIDVHTEVWMAYYIEAVSEGGYNDAEAKTYATRKCGKETTR